MFDLASRSALGTAHASTLVVQDTLDDLGLDQMRCALCDFPGSQC